MSTFNPQEFLTQTIEGANSTSFKPVPEGEYLLQVEKLDIRTVAKTGQVILDTTFAILDDGVKAAMGMEKVTVRKGIFLDLTAQGKIDTSENKNVDLGRLRAAVGQNDGSKPWGPLMLLNTMLKGKVGQRPDDEDPTKIYNDVKAFAPAA